MDKETWRAVVGYEGLYEVSSYGKLKRLAGYSKRIRYSKTKGHRFKDDEIYHPEIIFKLHLSKKGYVKGQLFKHDGERMKQKAIVLHRLVAEAFIGSAPEGKPQVNHIDGVKTNNYYKNLEWCSNTENQRHAIAMGLVPDRPKGYDNHQSKEINQIDLATGKVIKSFGSLAEAERITGIHRPNIKKVCQNKRLSAGGYSWEYVNK